MSMNKILLQEIKCATDIYVFQSHSVAELGHWNLPKKTRKKIEIKSFHIN